MKKLKQSELDLHNNLIRVWYTGAFPSDDVWKYIDMTITFDMLLYAMQHWVDAYRTIWWDYHMFIDTVVRERIFQRMSELYDIPYDEIYNLWLSSDEEDEAQLAEKDLNDELY